MKQATLLFTLMVTLHVNTTLRAQDNAELQQMADADQKARLAPKVDWKILNIEDSIRLTRTYELVKNNKLSTAKDFLNAGIIFQHGLDTTASALAVMAFGKAIQMDTSLNRWWYAAAVDRDLMRRNKPQIYGTQYHKNDTTGKWQLWKIDTTRITDAQRAYHHVPDYKGMLYRERAMNLKPIKHYYLNEPSVTKLISFLRTELEKGNASAYNVDEEEINSLGYNLLAKNKTDDAAAILQFNVQQFPQSWNANDSYGEVLLKLNKKKEAIKYYRRSLELNPGNSNATQVLSRIQ